jgi:RNA-binding protein
METLEGFQRKYLRGLAHSLKPVVYIGQKGLTTEVRKASEAAFESHELIKVKFNDFKEKDQKVAICSRLEIETESTMVGMIGHVAIFFRRHRNAEKRLIVLPVRKDNPG